ncbi:hypothetical protein T07_12173, partial [Trichinella nelsoni]
LKRLAARDPMPVLEIYDELASNASTSLKTAAYFPTWEQARNTVYYTRSKRYPRLLARRQNVRLTAEQTTTKSGAQFLMYHLPTNDILIFANEAERNHDFALELSGLYNWFSQRRESQYVRQSDHNTNYRRNNGQSKPNQVLTPFIKTTN